MTSRASRSCAAGSAVSWPATSTTRRRLRGPRRTCRRRRGGRKPRAASTGSTGSRRTSRCGRHCRGRASCAPMATTRCRRVRFIPAGRGISPLATGRPRTAPCAPSTSAGSSTTPRFALPARKSFEHSRGSVPGGIACAVCDAHPATRPLTRGRLGLSCVTHSNTNSESHAVPSAFERPRAAVGVSAEAESRRLIRGCVCCRGLQSPACDRICRTDAGSFEDAAQNSQGASTASSKERATRALADRHWSSSGDGYASALHVRLRSSTPFASTQRSEFGYAPASQSRGGTMRLEAIETTRIVAGVEPELVELVLSVERTAPPPASHCP